MVSAGTNFSDASTTRVDSESFGSQSDASLLCAPVSLPALGTVMARITIQTANTEYLLRLPQGREEYLFAPVMRYPKPPGSEPPALFPMSAHPYTSRHIVFFHAKVKWTFGTQRSSAGPRPDPDSASQPVIMSRRRRITPSRSAHGQTSSSANPNRSIAASATIAPAGSCGARRSDTPGSWARSAAGISASFSVHSVRSEPRSTRRWYGPSADGGAPPIRASCLNVLDVATTCSGGPYRATSPTWRAISARTCRRSLRTSSGDGGSALNQSRVSRPAPSGSEKAASGSSSIPTAISSEPPPMSTTSNRPDDQPNQRRTARKV